MASFRHFSPISTADFVARTHFGLESQGLRPDEYGCLPATLTKDATMGTEGPTPIVIPVHCAPKKAPCSECGKQGRRKRSLTRTVRTVRYKASAVLEITYGEYAASCDCCITFRTTPESLLPKAKYDNKVRDLVLERILQDSMNVERTLESIRCEFLLDLSTGFVYDVLHDHAATLDMAEHRRKVLGHFSGTLCTDELHLGKFIPAVGDRPAVGPARGLRPG
jgi:hypothetical protein